jgi:hypothetical protein
MPYRKLKPWGIQKPPLGSISDSNDTINSGLLGRWIMNEMGSGKVYDVSGFSNTGLFTGSPLPSWGTGLFGSAVSFNGSSTEIVCGSSGGFSPTPTAISISAWAKGTAFTNAYNAVAGSQGTGYFLILVKSTGKLAPYVRTGVAIDYDGTGKYTLSTNVWYHLVLTYDSVTGLICYVNANVDGTVAANGNLIAAASNFGIGYNPPTTTRIWTGLIDNVGIWSRALTSNEVQRLFVQPFAGIVYPRTERLMQSPPVAVSTTTGIASQVVFPYVNVKNRMVAYS